MENILEVELDAKHSVPSHIKPVFTPLWWCSTGANTNKYTSANTTTHIVELDARHSVPSHIKPVFTLSMQYSKETGVQKHVQNKYDYYKTYKYKYRYKCRDRHFVPSHIKPLFTLRWSTGANTNTDTNIDKSTDTNTDWGILHQTYGHSHYEQVHWLSWPKVSGIDLSLSHLRSLKPAKMWKYLVI